MARSEAVLITGCSTGIGRATAQHLARKGHTVYATARKRDAIADLEREGCRVLELDVTSEESMTAAVAAVEREEGAVGVLVNNAGYSQNGAVESVPMESIRRQFETNVIGLVRMCQLTTPKMREQGWGRVINISSIGGKMVFPGGGFYHATKHAVEAISDAMRFELAGFGVAVVIIEPGLIKTNFGETSVGSIGDVGDGGAWESFNSAVVARSANAYESGMLMKFGGGPEKVAKAIERAIKRPKARIPVTASARIMLTQRALTPDWLWDRSMRAGYPQPRP